MALESAIISTGALAAYGYGISRYGQGPRAGSLAFQALVFGQLLHAFSCRSDHHSLLGKKRPPTNPYLNAAVGGSLALQVLTLFIPGLRGFLGLTPPAVIDAAVIGAAALLPFLANESRKLVQSNPTQEVTT
jgi:Ca2+-transporting ATPase